MGLNFSPIVPSIPFILEGTLVTLQYTLLSVFFGFIIGAFLGLMKVSRVRVLEGIARGYTSIFRGTPLLVQLMIIYFALPQLIPYKLSAFEAGILAFSLNSGAYVSEIIRSGILSVDRGQFEAATSLGISYPLIMKDIILPQALKNILPALVNETVNLLKESALVSTIGEMDLLRRADIVAAEKYLKLEPLLFVAVVYYILVMTISFFADRLETRLRRHD